MWAQKLQKEKSDLQKLHEKNNSLIEEYQKLEARTRRLEKMNTSKQN